MTAPQSMVWSRRSCLAALGLTLVTGGELAVAKTPSPSSGKALKPEEAAFWQLNFNQLDGNAVSMGDFKGKPLVVNFWATWCPPCLEELPLLDAFYRENMSKGWQILGFAVDQVGSVKRFLAKKPLSFPVVMAGFDGTDLSRSLGNSSGGLPFTVVFGSAGDIRQRKIGRLSSADLLAWKRIGLV